MKNRTNETERTFPAIYSLVVKRARGNRILLKLRGIAAGGKFNNNRDQNRCVITFPQTLANRWDARERQMETTVVVRGSRRRSDRAIKTFKRTG